MRHERREAVGRPIAKGGSTAAGTDPMERHEVAMTRVFDAPRALVFEAWSKAEHVKQWYGPEDFTVPFCTMDFRVGGSIHLCMRSPEGEDFWSRGTYREIVVPERIVIVSTLQDDDDNARFEVLTTVTFEDEAPGTKLTMNARVIAIHDPAAAVHLADMEQGWSQALGRLAAHVMRYG